MIVVYLFLFTEELDKTIRKNIDFYWKQMLKCPAVAYQIIYKDPYINFDYTVANGHSRVIHFLRTQKNNTDKMNMILQILLNNANIGLNCCGTTQLAVAANVCMSEKYLETLLKAGAKIKTPYEKCSLINAVFGKNVGLVRFLKRIIDLNVLTRFKREDKRAVDHAVWLCKRVDQLSLQHDLYPILRELIDSHSKPRKDEFQHLGEHRWSVKSWTFPHQNSVHSSRRA